MKKKKTAALNLGPSLRQTLPLHKKKIVILSEQFPSNVYSWRAQARQYDATVCIVERPASAAGDWSRAVMDAIDGFSKKIFSVSLFFLMVSLPYSKTKTYIL